MAKVTIEGSISPSTRLARGEQAVVNDTDPGVQSLIRGGFVNVIDKETGEPEPTELPEPIKPPSKGASREAWAEFVEEHTDIEPGDKTRDVIVAEYEDWQTTHDAPTEDADES